MTSTETEMTYAQAAELIQESPNPEVAPDTDVWVVRVTGASFGFLGGPSGFVPTEHQYDGYTVIVDAASGQPIDACAGQCGSSD